MVKKARSPLQDKVLGGSLTEAQIGQLMGIMARTPEAGVRAAAIAEGFSVEAVNEFLKVMRRENVGVGTAVKVLGHNEMIAALDEKLSLALHHLDADRFKAANIQQIAIVFGILAEKRELLKGKPTQIFSFEERRSMRDLLPNALREAQRRGLVVDATYTEDNAVEPRLIQETVTEGAFNRTAGFVEKLPSERK